MQKSRLTSGFFVSIIKDFHKNYCQENFYFYIYEIFIKKKSYGVYAGLKKDKKS
jgi:hypothetical protein